MSNAVDVRGVLQYVPQFRGRIFVVLIEDGAIPEAAVAESLLDIFSLQKIGVQLVIGSLGGDVEDLINWAIEMEFKMARPLESLDAARAKEVLGRGQAAIFDASGMDALGSEMGEFAAEVGASKLIALCDGDRVIFNGAPLTAVVTSEISSLSTIGELVGEGYLKKAAEVCSVGVKRVHILNGRVQGVLVEELFSTEGVGTMVYADSYQTVRKLREEDIPELLAMIGRTVRANWLVPRNYEDIREKMDDYLVLTIDDNVVGCVALYPYQSENVSEVACLYVKQTHEGCGYGKLLVDAATDVAKERGNKAVFALTTKAASFFQRSLQWSEWSADELPKIRRDQWRESRRGSLVFGCALT